MRPQTLTDLNGSGAASIVGKLPWQPDALCAVGNQGVFQCSVPETPGFRSCFSSRRRIKRVDIFLSRSPFANWRWPRRIREPHSMRSCGNTRRWWWRRWRGHRRLCTRPFAVACLPGAHATNHVSTGHTQIDALTSMTHMLPDPNTKTSIEAKPVRLAQVRHNWASVACHLRPPPQRQNRA